MPTDNEEATRYIEALPSPQKEICQRLRDMIATKFPALKEQFKWSRPVYSSKSVDVCYMVANRSDVNFGFDFGTKLHDAQGLLEGTGINKRHLKFKSVEELDLDYAEQLLAEAISVGRPQAETPQ
jgi:hypothetical protein